MAQRMTWRILPGDARTTLDQLPERTVQTCVTSPPYFGLRDYGTGEWDGGDPGCDHVSGMARQDTGRETPGGRGGSFRGGEVQFRDVCGKCGATRTDHQIGLEGSVDEYVAALVDVFRAVRRVLRDDGTVWLNLGDSYASTSSYNAPRSMHTEAGWKQAGEAPNAYYNGGKRGSATKANEPPSTGGAPGLAGGEDGRLSPSAKPKDLIGVPWRVAFALQADGWWLRSEIIWAKPNPMPESVTDRPTRAHEQVFLLAKQPRYFFDADAIREAHETPGITPGPGGAWTLDEADRPGPDGVRHLRGHEAGRNKRSVWSIATQPYAGAHFATFPAKLIEPCILAGTPEKTCGECGAPWVRVVEASKYEPPTVAPGERFVDESRGDKVRKLSGKEYNEQVQRRTVGFEPSCDHHDDTGRALVLDPFAGSGTAGVVALRHNRSFIGCELNPEYVELARRRICDDAPLLNTGIEHVA